MESPEDLAELRERSARWRDEQDPGAQRKASFKTPSQVTVDAILNVMLVEGVVPPENRQAVTKQIY